MPSNHLILCRPLPLLPSIFPSIRVFSNESALQIRWPNYWGFCCSISPFSEYSGLISFRVDWFDPLPVQGTCKSLLQHNSSKASILGHQDFFMVQLSHPYMTTGKIIAWTMQTFVGKVMSLLFNMLSRFVIAFLPKEQVSFNFMPAVTIHTLPKCIYNIVSSSLGLSSERLTLSHHHGSSSGWKFCLICTLLSEIVTASFSKGYCIFSQEKKLEQKEMEYMVLLSPGI